MANFNGAEEAMGAAFKTPNNLLCPRCGQYGRVSFPRFCGRPQRAQCTRGKQRGLRFLQGRRKERTADYAVYGAGGKAGLLLPGRETARGVFV